MSNSSIMGKISNVTNSSDPQALERRIFVGNLNTFAMGKAEVRTVFERYGKVEALSLHPGYAFIQYADTRSARNAVTGEDRRVYMGQQIDVNISTEPKPNRPGPRKRCRPPPPPATPAIHQMGVGAPLVIDRATALGSPPATDLGAGFYAVPAVLPPGTISTLPGNNTVIGIDWSHIFAPPLAATDYLSVKRPRFDPHLVALTPTPQCLTPSIRPFRAPRFPSKTRKNPGPYFSPSFPASTPATSSPYIYQTVKDLSTEDKKCLDLPSSDVISNSVTSCKQLNDVISSIVTPDRPTHIDDIIVNGFTENCITDIQQGGGLITDSSRENEINCHSRLIDSGISNTCIAVNIRPMCNGSLDSSDNVLPLENGLSSQSSNVEGNINLSLKNCNTANSSDQFENNLSILNHKIDSDDDCDMNNCNSEFFECSTCSSNSKVYCDTKTDSLNKNHIIEVEDYKCTESKCNGTLGIILNSNNGKVFSDVSNYNGFDTESITETEVTNSNQEAIYYNESSLCYNEVSNITQNEKGKTFPDPKSKYEDKFTTSVNDKSKKQITPEVENSAQKNIEYSTPHTKNNERCRCSEKDNLSENACLFHALCNSENEVNGKSLASKTNRTDCRSIDLLPPDGQSTDRNDNKWNDASCFKAFNESLDFNGRRQRENKVQSLYDALSRTSQNAEMETEAEESVGFDISFNADKGPAPEDSKSSKLMLRCVTCGLVFNNDWKALCEHCQNSHGMNIYSLDDTS